MTEFIEIYRLGDKYPINLDLLSIRTETVSIVIKVPTETPIKRTFPIKKRNSIDWNRSVNRNTNKTSFYYRRLEPKQLWLECKCPPKYQQNVASLSIKTERSSTELKDQIVDQKVKNMTKCLNMLYGVWRSDKQIAIRRQSSVFVSSGKRRVSFSEVDTAL